MPNLKKKLAIVVIILVVSVAYHLFSPIFMSVTANDELPEVNYVLTSAGATTIAPLIEIKSGNLVSAKHPASGQVIIYENQGNKILRFENLQTRNGPGLSVYLATDTTGEDAIDIGEVKTTAGNVNYDLPMTVDLEKYDTVLIWCDTYNSLYSYSELK